MKWFILATTLAVATAACNTGSALAADKAPERPVSIQIAILLDTSNSMDGLIAQAKTQLWTVVNEFVKAKRGGKPPRLEVALYEYGNNGLSPSEGFVRLVLPLTDDLDKVSEQLFALKTNGGEEYCGKVIADAVAQLKWSPSRDVYKAIFIAGNEPFSQGPVDFHQSCRTAIGRGILVNTIFCGPDAQGQGTGWKDGAVLADGRYMSIDSNHQVVDIPAPQDAEIVRLNTDLNTTYIPYGKMGAENQMRQVAQDTNAVNLSQQTLVNRSVAKCNALYCPSDWDLVDAIKTGKSKLETLKDEELPEGLRKLSMTERKAKIEEASKRREEIQKKVNQLNVEREKFLAAERAKKQADGKETLDTALIKVVRDQATRQNFKFE